MIEVLLADADPEDKCDVCGHGPAYHDGQYDRPCRAWTDETPDSFCACPGWKLIAFVLKSEPAPT